MKQKRFTLLIMLLLTISIIVIKSNVQAATTSGHYTYENNSNGTITITKYNGTAANNLVIPNKINGKTVTSIGSKAFFQCEGLRGQLTIPSSVRSIGKSAFSGCSNLTSVTFSNGLIIIGDYAFAYCDGLTGNLVIPNSVTTIGNSAFTWCKGLSGDLIIPSSVRIIGSSVFNNCSNISSIIFCGNAPTISKDTFNRFSKKIYYIKGKTGFSGTNWPKSQMEESPFPDVEKNNWYYDSVNYVYKNKIITGYGDGTFGPNDYLTRGMVATILYRLEGSPNVTVNNVFPDVPSEQWYADAVQWAYNTGVVTGYTTTGTFGPNDNIKREDLALMLMRYAKYKGKYDSSSLKSLESYKDYKTVNEYATEGMKWAVGNGIITGNNNSTTLDPANNATRAEAATMIMRYCKNIFKWN